MHAKSTLTILALAAALVCPAATQPVVSAVLNGASYSAIVSPGCWVAIFGGNLAPSTLSAQAGPLPSTLGEVSVSVAGLAAPLLHVSPNQINALIPFEVVIPQDTVVPLVVTSPAGSGKYNIRLSHSAPAIFTRNGAGTGHALVFDSNFQAVDTVGPQDTVILYAAGLGPTNPPISTAAGGSGQVVDDVEVFIGERKAQVLFAGSVPEFPGIYQLNVKAPAPATDRLYLRSAGRQSNVVDVGIRSGTNTANVSGTIDVLYPSSDPLPRPCMGEEDPGPCGASGIDGHSVALHAGSFSVSFDIAPSAGPFPVAAVGEAGGSTIWIDPAAGTYTASVTTITPAAAAGDFSSSFEPLWDYASCTESALCVPFPDNRVPPSRISPGWVRATKLLPLPNTPGGVSQSAFLQISGNFSGSRFVIGDQNNSNLARFGGLVWVPYGPFSKHVSTFKLYVDGRLIASKDFPYVVPVTRTGAP